MADIFTKVEGPIVTNTTVGNVTFENIAEYIKMNIQSWSGKPVLWNLNEMEFDNVTSRDIQTFVAKMAASSVKKEGERAAIVAPWDIQFKIMKLLEILSARNLVLVNLRVFRTVAEAKDWLSISDGGGL